MIDALLHILTFFFDVIILVVGLLIVVAGIIALASKNKGASNKLKIKNLNEHYDEMKEALQENLLSKAELKALKKETKKENKQAKKLALTEKKKRIFVLDFQGDVRASAVKSLREEISAILTIATPDDQVLLRLESPGGVVHGYGLAASQLERLRHARIPLMVSVDKVAASGGYMMACVADRILSAPFAILGSIGVIAQIPNVHRLLKKHDIDFEQVTAGQYKRTLTVFGENTEAGKEKFQVEINEVHELFKEFISSNRPALDMTKVATGEHWFGTRAKELGLVDELITSDDYLLKQSEYAELLHLRYVEPKSFIQKIGFAARAGLEKLSTYATSI